VNGNVYFYFHFCLKTHSEPKANQYFHNIPTGNSKEAVNVAASNSNFNPTRLSPINFVRVAFVAKWVDITAASTWEALARRLI
jgi:hypothetical protein